MTSDLAPDPIPDPILDSTPDPIPDGLSLSGAARTRLLRAGGAETPLVRTSCAEACLFRTSGVETPLARVFAAAQCRTQLELARFLGIKQSSISDAKKRGAIPAEWLIRLLRERQIHPDWILTGQVPRTVQLAEHPEAVTLPQYPVEIRSPEQCTTEELLTEVVRRALQNIR